jgi:hypothetical protein
MIDMPLSTGCASTSSRDIEGSSSWTRPTIAVVSVESCLAEFVEPAKRLPDYLPRDVTFGHVKTIP